METPGDRRIALLMGNTLFTNVAMLAMGIAASVIINRGLGPSGKGVYATVMAVSGYLVLFASLGLNKSAVYFMAKPGAREEKIFQNLLLLFGLNLLLVCLLTGALYLLPFPNLLPAYYRLLWIPVLVLSLCQTLNNSFSGALRGLRFFNQLNLYNLSQSLMKET
jgi:stage V sporulation protein B